LDQEVQERWLPKLVLLGSVHVLGSLVDRVANAFHPSPANAVRPVGVLVLLQQLIVTGLTLSAMTLSALEVCTSNVVQNPSLTVDTVFGVSKTSATDRKTWRVPAGSYGSLASYTRGGNSSPTH